MKHVHPSQQYFLRSKSDTVEAVQRYINERGILYLVDYRGIQKDAEGWDHFDYTVRIKNLNNNKTLELPYKCGLGHAHLNCDTGRSREFLPARNARQRGIDCSYRDIIIDKTNGGEWCRLMRRQQPNRTMWHLCIETPSAASVIYSVLMERTHGELFPDWCDNFGYDSDSIKAREIYDFCQKQEIKLRGVLNNEQTEALEKLLEDY